ncbi:MAG: hypothetical protein Tsb0015_17430 [Simkaniaceae bacterium]
MAQPAKKGRPEKKQKTAQKKEVLESVKNDLHTLNHDWQQLLEENTVINDANFLKKMASDIQKLNHDAVDIEDLEGCEDLAATITYLLNTPWGAPFVGETTLVEAADKFKEKESAESELYHLMSGFAQYSHKFENQIIRAFEDIEKKMK